MRAYKRSEGRPSIGPPRSSLVRTKGQNSVPSPEHVRDHKDCACAVTSAQGGLTSACTTCLGDGTLFRATTR
jgi:hypothetical protein